MAIAFGHAPCVQFLWEERLNGERFSAAAALGGVRVAELELAAYQVFLVVKLGALEVDRAFHVHDDTDAVYLVGLSIRADLGGGVSRDHDACPIPPIHHQ